MVGPLTLGFTDNAPELTWTPSGDFLMSDYETTYRITTEEWDLGPCLVALTLRRPLERAGSMGVIFGLMPTTSLFSRARLSGDVNARVPVQRSIVVSLAI